MQGKTAMTVTINEQTIKDILHRVSELEIASIKFEHFVLMEEKLENALGRVEALEIAFIDYTEEHQKSSQQWTEERLRALECEIKVLRSKLND